MKAAYKAYGASMCVVRVLFAFMGGWMDGLDWVKSHLLDPVCLLSSPSRSCGLFLPGWTEERMLVELKEEMPGLKLSQYKVSERINKNSSNIDAVD